MEELNLLKAWAAGVDEDENTDKSLKAPKRVENEEEEEISQSEEGSEAELSQRPEKEQEESIEEEIKERALVKRKKVKKKTASIYWVAIGAILLIIFAYYFYSKYAEKKDTSKTTNVNLTAVRNGARVIRS